eukprot:3941214-Rhodomonas_salina.5
MSGTDVAYGDSRVPPTQCSTCVLLQVKSAICLRACYALSAICLRACYALSVIGLPACHAMSGTAIAYADSACARAMAGWQWAVLPERMVPCDVRYCPSVWCYVMSGTDVWDSALPITDIACGATTASKTRQLLRSMQQHGSGEDGRRKNEKGEERKREKEQEKDGEEGGGVLKVCVCERERERESVCVLGCLRAEVARLVGVSFWSKWGVCYVPRISVFAGTGVPVGTRSMSSYPSRCGQVM